MIKKLLIFFMLASTAICFAQFGEPQAALQPEEHDFGNIVQGNSVSSEFEVINSGGDILKILNVRGSCGCTAAKPEKDALEPGESTKIKVTFNSEGRMGPQTKYVYVTTNDPKNNRLTFKFTGNIILQEKETSKVNAPKIHFDEVQYDFGTVKEGNVVDYTFNFVNQGKSTLTILNVRTTCDCADALLSEKKIEPGKKGTLKVELDTKNRSGRMSRNIVVNSNDPDEPVKVLTIYAEVKKEIN